MREEEGGSKLLIRADASAEIGTGHVMRMLALAQAWQEQGGEVTLASCLCPEGLVERLAEQGVEFYKIKGAKLGGQEDLAETAALAKRLSSEWLVTDGYHFELDYQRAVKKSGLKLMAVDDHGYSEKWAADAILNQNIYASEIEYDSEVEGCRFLLGLRFALLRREFREFERGKRAVRNVPIKRLLITFGGADKDNLTAEVIRVLNAYRERVLEIKVLVGASNSHVDSLEGLVKQSNHEVELLKNVRDMPSLYHWAEGIIGAGGSTCWEWMFFGLRGMVFCLAENQRQVCESLKNKGAAIYVESMRGLRESLEGFLSGQNREQLGGSKVQVDGFGALRAAGVMGRGNCYFRPAYMEDSEWWFGLVNDPLLRANSFHSEPIARDTHQEWFEKHLLASRSRLYVMCDVEDSLLCFSRLHQVESGDWEVGIAVSPQQRGRGLGKMMLSQTFASFQKEQAYSGDSSYVARIRPENKASIRLFTSLGFKEEVGASGEGCKFVRSL